MELKTRRLMALLLLLPVLLLLLPGAGFPGQTELTVMTPETLPKAGEEFLITVEIGGNPGLCAAQFTLAYDRSAVSCTAADAGEILSGTLWVSNPAAPAGAVIAAASTDPAEGDGTLAEYCFTALTDLTEWPFALAAVSLADTENADIPFVTGVAVSGAGTEAAEEPPEDEPQAGDAETELPPIGGKTAEQPQEEAPQEEMPTEEPVEGPSGEAAQAEEPTAEPEPVFPDISGHWGEAFVKEASALGLFQGYPDGSFRPDDPVKRGDFVLVLWRMSGQPEPAGESPFTDVTPGGYYYEAILWAYEQGFVKGVSETMFAPDDLLTREQAMTLLFRYSGGVSGMELFFTGTYDAAYRDSGDIADWAKPAMYWAVFQTLIEGTGPDTLSPKMNATRAQLAKLLVNYIQANP